VNGRTLLVDAYKGGNVSMKNLRPALMNGRLGFLLLLLCVSVALMSCQRGRSDLDLESERQLVERAIHSSIGWAKEKDIDLLYSVIANDSDYVEVDPEARVVKGFEDFQKAEAFWMSDDFKAIRYEITDLKISFSKSGDVAWFFCMLDDINEWKGQPANWENTRWTGVLEKRNGNWVIVQMHFSFASD
jgi:ketosteroid isomerase-like protein